MRIDEYVIICLAPEAKYGCNDTCINLTKSDIKAVSGFNSVRLTLADALLLPLSVLLPAPPHTAWSCDTLLEMSLVRIIYAEYYKDDIVNLRGFELGFEYHPETF